MPLLRDGDELLTQSLAIIEYLDETHPSRRCCRATPAERARVRALALDIACEIHPLDNLRVLRYLVRELGIGEEDKDRWYRHWVETGLEAVERKLAGSTTTGRYCHGDAPTLADCVLVPQVFNAQRYQCRLDHVPTVMRIFETCMQHEAFIVRATVSLPRRGSMSAAWLSPSWPGSGVAAAMTTRHGGFSVAPVGRAESGRACRRRSGSSRLPTEPCSRPASAQRRCI